MGQLFGQFLFVLTDETASSGIFLMSLVFLDVNSCREFFRKFRPSNLNWG